MTTAPKLSRSVAARRKPLDETVRAGTEKILDAAAQMFMRRGYAATSIDEIAAVLGSTKGRIYHHYTSKAALFFDVHLFALRRMLDMARPIVAAEGTPSAKMRALAHAQARVIMTGFAANKVALQGLERHVVGSAGSAQRKALRQVVELRDEYEALFVGQIEDGIRVGEFAASPPRMVAKAALGAINWLTVWYNPERATTPKDIETIAATIAEFVVRGLGSGVI